MSDHLQRIQEAKSRLLIPDLWRMLNLEGQPPRNGTGACRSPFRPDKHPSFSIYDEGRKWKDHSADGGGDAVDFIQHAEGRERPDAIIRLLALAGLPAPVSVVSTSNTAPQFPDVSAFRMPTDEEIVAVANLRRLHPDAVHRMAHFQILRAGHSHGHHVWALVDGPPGQRPRVAEIRRIDGGLIPTRDNEAGVKGLTIRGSKKDWPIGASLLDIPRKWKGILLCEGMPDFLAAAHFAHGGERFDLCPVAILGRSNQRLHEDAIALLEGKRIRVFPHADADGGGMHAAERWASMIPNADVDAFDFAGLRRRDGKPVNDLNDCAVIHPDDQGQLSELLP